MPANILTIAFSMLYDLQAKLAQVEAIPQDLAIILGLLGGWIHR